MQMSRTAIRLKASDATRLVVAKTKGAGNRLFALSGKNNILGMQIEAKERASMEIDRKRPQRAQRSAELRAGLEKKIPLYGSRDGERLKKGFPHRDKHQHFQHLLSFLQ
jgi:hypothetical protein